MSANSPDAFRDEIRNCTGLRGEALDLAISKLLAATGQYLHSMEMYEREGPSQLVRPLELCADKMETLAEELSAAPALVRETIGLSIDELRRRATVARQYAAFASEGAKKQRPILPGIYRDALARSAREILEPHCADLPRRMLRRAVAVVLDAAGAPSPNWSHDPGKFDRMMQRARRDTIAEEAKVRACETVARIGDVPI
jgi:hypothetical protein